VKLRMIKKQVEVLFEDGTSLEGSFFLSPTSAHHWGTESIEELLNGDRKYLPMELNPEEVVLLSKNAIVMASAKEKETEPPFRGPTRIPAEVVFRSGKTLSGVVYHDLPMTHSRLSDYLNRSGSFFHMEVGSVDCFVATDFVRLIKSLAADKECGSP
jgi:hypothetical protein